MLFEATEMVVTCYSKNSSVKGRRGLSWGRNVQDPAGFWRAGLLLVLDSGGGNPDKWVQFITTCSMSD